VEEALRLLTWQKISTYSPVDFSEDPDTGELIWQHHAQVSQHLADVLTNMVRRHHTLRYSGSAAALQAFKPIVLPTVVPPSLQIFQFEVVTVDKRGNITQCRPSKANFFTEDLGNDITLEMVEITGGQFIMGSPVVAKKRDLNESPKHTVTIQPFFMGKFVE
jgi:eukaryotic-like serine/threonine-protein kinase